MFSSSIVKVYFYLEQSQDDNIKMLVLKWSKVFDGVQLIRNRLQQDVQLHSEFKGNIYCFEVFIITLFKMKVL